ncbi:hypothetical protein Emag_003998 [Eimeria magna]
MATERGPQRTPSGDLLLEENESLGMKVQDISLFIRGKDAGRGVLFVTSQRVAWLSASNPSFALSYLSIVLHALSSETEGGEKPYLYCQIKGEAMPAMTNGHPVGVAASESEGGDHEDDSSNEYEPMVELKFVPDDSSCLSRLFAVLSEMAALHVDETAHLDGDEDELFDDAALRRQGWEFLENSGENPMGDGDANA